MLGFSGLSGRYEVIWGVVGCIGLVGINVFAPDCLLRARGEDNLSLRI